MTSQYPNVSERLAQTFATWQMYFLGHELEVAIQQQQGNLTKKDMVVSQKGTQLPNVILDNSVSQLNSDDWQPRTINGTVTDFGSQIELYTHFPYELFQWNRASRRAFHLPHSLEAMLAAAELPDMTWDDVLWPFESFIVTVEKPIVVHHPLDGTKQKFDTILVTKSNSATGGKVHLRWIHTPQSEGKKLGLTVQEIKRFRTLLGKGKIPEAAKLWDRRYKEIHKFYPFQIGSQNVELEIEWGKSQKLITEADELYTHLGAALDWQGQPLKYDDAGSKTFFESLSVTLRIVVGWMLYLESMKRESTEWRPGQKHKTRLMSGGSPSVIIEPENVCTIVGEGRIKCSELTSERGTRCSKGYVRPHWRRAHYRRPAGSSPTAQKTQRVPPVLVRADLVPLYGIVGGTNTIVISED